MNNPELYELSEADKHNIRIDLMWPASMVPLLPRLRTPAQEVKLHKAMAYSGRVARGEG
jgi:hypothetical protein